MNNNSEKNIHWFPGHMKKASDQIKDKLKLVDFVICLLDARSPYSTFNKYLLKIVENYRNKDGKLENTQNLEKDLKYFNDYLDKIIKTVNSVTSKSEK